MGFEMVKENYTGSIKGVTLGQGDKAVTVGGESCLPFHQFEGEIGNKPKIAMEVWDTEPPEWPEQARAPFKDCLNDPAAWAKKCVEDYGADMIVLQLKSTDPNDQDASPAEAVATVKKVLDAIDVPLIIWGTANVDKDAQTLKKIAEDCEGANLAIGPVEDANHKSIGAAIMGFGHTAIASSPIDINLAKQVNILLENLGLPTDRIIIDPTTGGLGYGMEYSYSVMERIKLAALTFGDNKLQLPVINNLANEVWKCKEAKEGVDEAPTLGDPERRGVLMEAVGAVTYLMAGSNILIMRHPEAVRMTRSFIDLMVDGGSAMDVAGITKLLSDVDVDYASHAPELDLSIKDEEKKAAPKKEAKAAPAKEEAKAEPAKEEAKPAEAKAEPAKEEAKPAKEEPKPAEAKAEPAKEEAKPTPEEEAKAKAEAEAKKEAEEKARAEAEEKAKKEAEEKAKKEAEDKARQEEESRVQQQDDDFRALEEKLKKSKASAPKKAAKKEEKAATKAKPAAAGEAKSTKPVTEEILEKLNIFHRRFE